MISSNNTTNVKDKESLIKLEKSLDEFIKILEETSTDNTKIDSILIKLQNTINDNESIITLLSGDTFRNVFEKIAAWILKNFSSVKLNPIINLVSLILHKLNYKVELKREEIIKLLQLETYEQLLNSDKKEKQNYEEIISKESIITNPFLSAFYALIVTIANKPEIIIKSKNLLKSIITVLTQICEIDNIAIYYKKKRLISVFIKILKELKASSESNIQPDSLINITKLLMYLFAKIGLKRPIYRDYMFKKAVPDKLTDIFVSQGNKDPECAKIFSIYCFFSIRTVDHKTFYWTKGVINNLLEILSTDIKSNKEDEERIEYITLALYNLSVENIDIQSELQEQNFLELAKEILMKYSKNNFIIFNIISTLRRIKDEEYINKIAKELLYTFFALFDYFYLTVKKEIEKYNKEDEINNLSNKFEFIILKELVAVLGNIVKDEVHSKPFIEKNLHLVLIDLKLSFNSFPKLIKNTIGAMINLTTSNEIRESLSKVAAFIQSIYVVLDKYKDNQAIIDYELKLIINVMKNDITVKTFISGDMFFYLLLFLTNFVSHDEIIFNSVKIIRTLILKSNNENHLKFI